VQFVLNLRKWMHPAVSCQVSGCNTSFVTFWDVLTVETGTVATSDRDISR